MEAVRTSLLASTRLTLQTKIRYELLQLIQISFLKANKAFNIYALIDPGSQCVYILDAISENLELPCKSHQSVPLHQLTTEINMTLSKKMKQSPLLFTNQRDFF